MTLVAAFVVPPTLSLAAFASASHPATAGKDCLACHAPILQRKALHQAAKDTCDACHVVPAAGGATSFTEVPEKLCLACHDQKLAGKFVHGPVAVGACVACHDPHSSDNAHLLRQAGQAMCTACHAEMESRLANTSFQHKALETGCTSCHDPHASAQRFQLKAPLPEMCTSCHARIGEMVDRAPVGHAAVKESKSCLNCHDAHAAARPRLLAADGVSTCLGCHDKRIEAAGSALADMGKLLAENLNHHGPIREKDCSGCHQPHGSAHFRLLNADYPKEFYAPFREENFALCFGCHDPALTRDERTTNLTDFRNGDRNLHFVHVNKTPKGRTCRSCHETHASSLPNHIRKSVPFGRWELPVNFTKTANGGTCAPGCHAPQSYDRATSIQAQLE